MTHLDNELGIQITDSVMKEVKDDQVYQRILKEVGMRLKRGLRELPCNHLAQAHKNMWDSLHNAHCQMERR